MKGKLKKRFLVKFFAIMLISATSIVSLSGCTGGDNSGGSGSISQKDMNDMGYYKKNGKWYYQGDGAY